MAEIIIAYGFAEGFVFARMPMFFPQCFPVSIGQPKVTIAVPVALM
jgi:hypothetical protein